MVKRFYFLAGLVLSGFIISAPAWAVCGGDINCIAVSIDPSVAPFHGPLSPRISAPLNFGNQAVTTTSAARTIFVGAVLHRPAGDQATLQTIMLSGANAAEFNIAATTCTTGAPSLPHNGTITATVTCSIFVTFNPVTLGAKAAQIDVQTAAIIRTVPLRGAGTGTAPAAIATTLTVPADTPTTLDLAPFATGTNITGVRLTALPANGVASLTGTRVTYVPNPGYLGPDAFSFVSFSGLVISAPAVVTVAVVARPNPANDPNVVGLINAQAQTAWRFARAQISNLQRRMESLHRGAGDGQAAGANRWAPGRGLSSHSGAGATVNSIGGGDITGFAQPGIGPLARSPNEPGGLRQAGTAGTASGSLPPSLMTALLGAATTGAVNLSRYSGGTSDASGLPDGTGLWIGGNLQFGTRGPTGDSSGLRFSTDGVSLGVDRRFSDKLALGLGVGYARDRTDIGADGSQSRSNGSSISIYSSYQPTANTFVDGLLGYGALSYDTDRFVAAANDFARSRRKGDQVFGSLAAGYEHRRDALLLSPYGRLDFTIDRLERATETGAGLNALTYFDQNLHTLQFSLGLRAESQHATNFGRALPRLRVEFRHDLSDDRQATVAYADQFAGPRYSVTPGGLKRDALVVGIGSDFWFRDGLKLGVDYQAERSSGSDRGQAIRLWLSKEIDGKRSPSGILPSSLFANPVRVEAGYSWDDNLTRARDAADKLTDHIYSLDVSKSFVLPVGSHTRVVINGFLNGDKLYTYSGLDRFSGGAKAEFQYRTSGAFDALTLGVFGRASVDEYNSALRSGNRYSLGVTARQSLTDRIDVFGALSKNVRDADSVVFDARDYALRFNLDYSLGEYGTPYFGGEYRRGDAVSTGRQSIDSIAVAKALVQDDAYGNNQLFAYRLEARTVLWTLGYNLPLGPRDSIDFSWRNVRSAATQSPNYALAGGYGLTATPMGAPRYSANQYSIAYLMRF